MEQKIATSIQQSEKLLELGLSSDTADMYYYKYYPITQIPRVLDGKLCAVDIPSWSLSALLELMPKDRYIDISLSYGGYSIEPLEYIKKWFISFEKENLDDRIIKNFSSENPIDAAFDMICWLLEQGFIEKGGEK